jgi:hypothetical protein
MQNSRLVADRLDGEIKVSSVSFLLSDAQNGIVDQSVRRHNELCKNYAYESSDRLRRVTSHISFERHILSATVTIDEQIECLVNNTSSDYYNQ